jgi:hypothetical protein
MNSYCLIYRKTPQDFLGRYVLFTSVPFEGTFDGSRDLRNPNVSYFPFDEFSPKMPGGSETDITSSSFEFEKPQLRFEVVQL